MDSVVSTMLSPSVNTPASSNPSLVLNMVDIMISGVLLLCMHTIITHVLWKDKGANLVYLYIFVYILVAREMGSE